MITTVVAFLASKLTGLALLGSGGGIAGWAFRSPVKRWCKKHPLLLLHLVAAAIIAIGFGIEQWRIGTRDDTIAEQAKTINQIKEASAALDARLKLATEEITRRNAYRAKLLSRAKAGISADPDAQKPASALWVRALQEPIE